MLDKNTKDNSVNVARQRVTLSHPDSHFRLSGLWGMFPAAGGEFALYFGQ
jgi:hypothetical protein